MSETTLAEAMVHLSKTALRVKAERDFYRSTLRKVQVDLERADFGSELERQQYILRYVVRALALGQVPA